jgi:hypothetical protein
MENKEEKKSKKKGCLKNIAVIVGVFALLMGVIIAIADDPFSEQYKIVEYEVYDVPLKSQVSLHAVLVDSTLTEQRIKEITESFIDRCEREEMQYHGGKPTDVYVYLHKSDEEYESGIWLNSIATYQRTSGDPKGVYRYKFKDSEGNDLTR